MGFVVRKERKVFVRTDNFQRIKDKNKAKELLVKNLAIERKGILIIIYKELDFNEFYKKHCQRIPNDNNFFTVLVEEDIKIPEKEAVKKLIEDALLSKIERDDNKIIVEIPHYLFKPKHYVRTMEKGKFISKPTYGRFRFRDIKDLSKIGLDLNKRETLIKEDFEKLDCLWKTSFTAESEFSIKEIWLIGHIDVI